MSRIRRRSGPSHLLISHPHLLISDRRFVSSTWCWGFEGLREIAKYEEELLLHYTTLIAVSPPLPLPCQQSRRFDERSTG
mmetsp:Transcript_20758/g.51493  ORF Transcript_20758/g.51493 Transcript_20758/m.51493 type:complete len:80 (-) Transcript_20758:67-306(-)